MALNSGVSVRRSPASQCSSFFLEFEQDKSWRLIASLRLSSRTFDFQKSFSLAPQMKCLHLKKTWIMTSGSKCILVYFLKFPNTLETLLQLCVLLYHYMLVVLCVSLVLFGVEALWEQTLEQFQTNIFLSNVDQSMSSPIRSGDAVPKGEEGIWLLMLL
jgi:hypothetical protein